MSMDNTVSFEELQRRRQSVAAARKPSQTPQPRFETDSEAMAVIHEIFHPSLKLPESRGPYKLPDALSADDQNHEIDISKLAELKEVFLLFDTDCDGLISKDDLRFTFMALGNSVSEEQLEDMLKEGKDPLDLEAFVQLISHRTIELDPEDVLLEAWSKWDDYGTGKIDEKNCLDYVEIFPYLREPVIENSTQPEYVFCNRTNGSSTASKASASANFTAPAAAAVASVASNSSSSVVSSDLRGAPPEFIYSASKVFGIRVRFQKPQQKRELNAWNLNITGEYRFLKKDNFKNDGRLIVGSYCDYYFFADATNSTPKTLDIWQHFHSPRFPAKYPAHIKCAYKFIGRPESRVEIVFEELQIPRQAESCSMDKLTIFDSESANMNAVIDVVCDALPTRRIISSGPDLLIEFNASSNVTAKGFRGKFKFLHNEVAAAFLATTKITTEAVLAVEKLAVKGKQTKGFNANEFGKIFKTDENCKQVFDSRANNKSSGGVALSGTFKSAQLFVAANPVFSNVNNLPGAVHHFAGRVQCRYDFYGEADERVQIKFLDFNIPTDIKNSSECKPTESLQLLTQERGKYEAAEIYCGAFLPKPIMSNGPKLLLQFQGKYPPVGSKTSFYGFKAEYRFLTNFGITTGQQLGNNCTFSYNSTQRKSGWFASPNFPGLYPQNMFCNYYFQGEDEEYVNIRFTYFDVEGIGTCEYSTASDYVEFSNFMSTDRKYSKYCGKQDKFEVRSDGRFFRITFYSNDRFDKTGFRALYDFESKNTPAENTSMQSYHSGKILHSSVSWQLIIFVNFLYIYIQM